MGVEPEDNEKIRRRVRQVDLTEALERASFDEAGMGDNPSADFEAESVSLALVMPRDAIDDWQAQKPQDREDQENDRQ